MAKHDQSRKLPGWSVVAHDGLASKKSPQETGHIFELRRRNGAHAVRLLHHGNAAPETENEAPAGEALHRAGIPGGDHEVSCVVIGASGGDDQILTDRSCGSAQCCCFLLVVSLGDKRCAKPQRFTIADFVDDLAG